MLGGVAACLKEIALGRVQRLWMPLVAVALGLAVGAAVIAAGRESPLTAYRAMLDGAAGTGYRFASTLAKATPLMLCGLSVAVAFNAGIWNIGSEGQLYLGGFAAAWVGFTVRGLPSILHVALCMLAACAAGGLWALFPGWLRVRWGTNEVVTTIMLNHVATLFTSYLVNYPFRVPGSARGATVYVAPTAELARPVEFSRFNVGFFVALGVVAAVWFLMRRTTVGFEWKLVGLNPEFARYSGVQVGQSQLLAMAVSGMLAGLAGSIEALGVHQRFIDNISPGYGFDGILIALMVGNDPLGVVLVSLFFAGLTTGSIGMEQVTRIPSELSAVIQSVIILFAGAQVGLAAVLASLRGAVGRVVPVPTAGTAGGATEGATEGATRRSGHKRGKAT